MDRARCMWCKHARERYGVDGSGISCTVGTLIAGAYCREYEAVEGVEAAKSILEDFPWRGNLRAMRNQLKWALRERGGELDLLASALIDQLQGDPVGAWPVIGDEDMGGSRADDSALEPGENEERMNCRDV